MWGGSFMFGKTCPKCEFENSEDANFCMKCGKDLKETIAYFEGDSGGHDIEVTPNTLIVYKRSLWSGKRTGKVKVYEREKMENIEVGRTSSHLSFKYNGKRKGYRISPRYLDEVEEILELGEIREPPIYVLNGLNGKLKLYENRVEIKRLGFGAKLVYGTFTAGDKTIYLQDITGVEVKKPGITVGYIQLTLPGGIEKTSGAFKARIDENTVTFAQKNDYKIALKIKEKIEELKTKISTGTATVSVVDEIKKVKELLDIGAITKEEFEKIKRELLK